MLSTIYALLCIIVPCSLYQLIICKRQNKKQENKAIHFVWVYIFLLYIYLTFSVAGIGSIWDIGHYDTIIRLEEINLLPFQSEGIMTNVFTSGLFNSFNLETIQKSSENFYDRLRFFIIHWTLPVIQSEKYRYWWFNDEYTGGFGWILLLEGIFACIS